MVKNKFPSRSIPLPGEQTRQRRSLLSHGTQGIILSNVTKQVPCGHRQLASFLHFYHSERQKRRLIILLFCISLSQVIDFFFRVCCTFFFFF